MRHPAPVRSLGCRLYAVDRPYLAVLSSTENEGLPRLSALGAKANRGIYVQPKVSTIFRSRRRCFRVRWSGGRPDRIEREDRCARSADQCAPERTAGGEGQGEQRGKGSRKSLCS